MSEKREYKKKAELVYELNSFSLALEEKIKVAMLTKDELLDSLKVTSKDINRWISAFDKSNVTFNEAYDGVSFLFRVAEEDIFDATEEELVNAADMQLIH